MNTTLEINRNELTGLSTLINWLKQKALPVATRWWMWIVLIISPAYLTYYFMESSLDERVSQAVSQLESRKNKLIQEGKFNDGKYKKSLSFRQGYTAGLIAGVIIRNAFVFSVIILLFVALLQIQYQYVFQKLFEKNKPGRRIYIGLVLICWLSLVIVLPDIIGEMGQAYYWDITNGFIITNICYSLLMSWRNSRRRQLALIQQRTQAELDALKAQINPHFLFNSLNNIYGTAILEDSPRTAESIQQLSGIVRYVMEESRLQMTTIQRELRFIDDFVELQRVRLPIQANIDISTTIEWDEQPAQIAPLLLNPLIENAFKYGISIQHPCFVHIRLQVQNGMLHLTTKNSIQPRTDIEKGTGLGLTNVRQRLALAYPERHTLRVKEENDTFSVDLTVNL